MTQLGHCDQLPLDPVLTPNRSSSEHRTTLSVFALSAQRIVVPKCRWKSSEPGGTDGPTQALPVVAGYLIASPIRKLWQDPALILEPYNRTSREIAAKAERGRVMVNLRVVDIYHGDRV